MPYIKDVDQWGEQIRLTLEKVINSNLFSKIICMGIDVW